MSEPKTEEIPTIHITKEELEKCGLSDLDLLVMLLTNPDHAEHIFTDTLTETLTLSSPFVDVEITLLDKGIRKKPDPSKESKVEDTVGVEIVGGEIKSDSAAAAHVFSVLLTDPINSLKVFKQATDCRPITFSNGWVSVEAKLRKDKLKRILDDAK